MGILDRPRVYTVYDTIILIRPPHTHTPTFTLTFWHTGSWHIKMWKPVPFEEILCTKPTQFSSVLHWKCKINQNKCILYLFKFIGHIQIFYHSKIPQFCFSILQLTMSHNNNDASFLRSLSVGILEEFQNKVKAYHCLIKLMLYSYTLQPFAISGIKIGDLSVMSNCFFSNPETRPPPPCGELWSIEELRPQLAAGTIHTTISI